MVQAHSMGFKALLSAVALLVLPALSSAQTYPTKSVRLLVGWAPGGGVDVTARTIAQQLSATWGQQILVENRPGAAGNLAGDVAARAAPDGYTIFLGSIGELAVNATLFKNMPYHPVNDLTHIAMAVRVPNILVVHPSVRANNVKELVELSRKQPNGLTFASPGNGSIGHLSGELLKTMTGANLLHVPYKGAAPATADIVGGQVQLGFSSIPAVLPHVQGGRLRALAVTTRQRVEAVPQLPTIAESGYKDFSAVGWYAFVGPAGMPPSIVAKLNQDINQALGNPALKAKLTAQGLEPWTMKPQELRSYMAEEITRWGKVVVASGSKVD